MTTIEAPFCADLIPIKQIYFCLEQDSNKHVYGPGYFRASACFRDTARSSFGGVFRYEPRCGLAYFFFKFERRCRELSWRMYDERFQPIDFCGNEVTFLMTKCSHLPAASP